MNNRIRIVIYGGVLSAVILLATDIIKFPIPTGYGYVNFGDGAIFATAAIMGPYAAISAALGSALADLIAGFPMYIPATALIKGLMGLSAGFVLNKHRTLPWYFQAVLFLFCEIIMVAGYFFYEWALYASFAAAAGQLIFNAIQGIAGIVTGLAIVPLARKIKISQFNGDMV